MLRDPSLIPLSRQHQHALALCVRIDRSLKAGIADLDNWQPQIDEQFRQEIRFHFDAEEAVLFPAAEGCGLTHWANELKAEHQNLRRYFALASARAMTAADLREFADLLSTHIRKEERDLFEELQRRMSPADLQRLGAQLETSLQEASQACALPRTSDLTPDS